MPFLQQVCELNNDLEEIFGVADSQSLAHQVSTQDRTGDATHAEVLIHACQSAQESIQLWLMLLDI